MRQQVSHIVRDYGDSSTSSDKASPVVAAHSPTIYHAMLNSGLSTSEKRVERMAQEGFVLLAAGGDTVARNLTIAAYHVLSNPSVLVRLKDELRRLLPDPNVMPEVVRLEEAPWLVLLPRAYYLYVVVGQRRKDMRTCLSSRES